MSVKSDPTVKSGACTLEQYTNADFIIIIIIPSHMIRSGQVHMTGAEK